MNDLSQGRTSQYMHTSTGKPFFPFDPRVEDWNIDFIAHHLACQGRWNGATQHPTDPTKIFFSVAEHSVEVSLYVENELGRPDLALEALMHDGPEGPLGDIIRPLKYSDGIKQVYGAIEHLNEVSMSTAFNLVHPFPREIKIADEAVCCAEKKFFVPMAPGFDWTRNTMLDDTNCASFEPAMLSPFGAKQLFLNRYREILKTRARYRALPIV